MVNGKVYETKSGSQKSGVRIQKKGKRRNEAEFSCLLTTDY